MTFEEFKVDATEKLKTIQPMLETPINQDPSTIPTTLLQYAEGIRVLASLYGSAKFYYVQAKKRILAEKGERDIHIFTDVCDEKVLMDTLNNALMNTKHIDEILRGVIEIRKNQPQSK